MQRKVLWDPAAWTEIEEALEYYGERSLRAAEDLRGAIDDAVNRIAQGGETYPLFDRGARRFLLEKYPLGLLYTFDDEYAVVTVVMHTSRRPGDGKG